MADNQAKKQQNLKAEGKAKMEEEFLNGTKDETLGVYCDLFSAKSTIQGQDGGVVSALLIKGFKEGLFDAAIVVRRMEGYSAEAVIALNDSDVLTAKGTKYLKVNVTKKLRQLVEQGKKRIAIVCTPCEAKAVRIIQQTLKENCQITVLGLFCFEAFNQAKLKQEVKAKFGVDLDKADKTQVRGGKFLVQVDGKEYGCKVKDLEGAAEKACGFCDDFTSRFADVSVGSVGAKRDFSTVIVRSSVGKKLVENLDVTKEAADKQEVSRISIIKRERALINLRNRHS
ncbi:MAG: Coenzyme F420 hydrogenase/dehydrogenase, beta subunit C-terminal domain [Bacillota bacterium]